MTSTGLSPRAAAALAYSGWWATGALIWLAERRDPVVRFHAAQAVIVFGVTALLVALFGALAVASLGVFPAAFGVLAGAAALTWLAGLGLWGIVMGSLACGDGWRIPVAAGWADRMTAAATSSQPGSA